jgi:hypothetical protein
MFLLLLVSFHQPDRSIVGDLLHSEAHSRKQIRNGLKERISKSIHEANLAVGELENVAEFWWTSKQSRFNSNLELHFALFGKFELEYIRPPFCNYPRPCLQILVK